MLCSHTYTSIDQPSTEAFDVAAAEDMRSQGDSAEDGGILNDYTLASMVFGSECGDMRIRFFGDPSGAGCSDTTRSLAWGRTPQMKRGDCGERWCPS